MRAWLAVILVGAIVGIGSSARAQGYGPGYYQGPPPPPPQGMIRSGFIAGLSVGLGAISFTDCDRCDALGGIGFQFHLGGMLAPNLALMFDYSLVGHVVDNSDTTLVSNMMMGVLRGWLGRILWLQAGLGVGWLSLSDPYGVIADTETGFGLTLGAGIDVVQIGNFAVDIQLRIAAARYAYGDGVGVGNSMLLVGFNWY